jgi:hypothetical protein
MSAVETLRAAGLPQNTEDDSNPPLAALISELRIERALVDTLKAECAYTRKQELAAQKETLRAQASERAIKAELEGKRREVWALREALMALLAKCAEVRGAVSGAEPWGELVDCEAAVRVLLGEVPQ